MVPAQEGDRIHSPDYETDALPTAPRGQIRIHSQLMVPETRVHLQQLPSIGLGRGFFSCDGPLGVGAFDSGSGCLAARSPDVGLRRLGPGRGYEQSQVMGLGCQV